MRFWPAYAIISTPIRRPIRRLRWMCASADRQVRHVIARGDTLSEIAERYNVSPAAIRSANKLSNDKIRVGQTTIPVFAGS